MAEFFVTNGLASNRRTEGTWVHTGRLIISFKLEDGTVKTITLPDDLVPTVVPNSIEDLTYGG